jgi:hypothetical protein
VTGSGSTGHGLAGGQAGTPWTRLFSGRRTANILALAEAIRSATPGHYSPTIYYSKEAPRLHACLREYGDTEGRGDLPDQRPCDIWAVDRWSPMPIAMRTAAQLSCPDELP